MPGTTIHLTATPDRLHALAQITFAWLVDYWVQIVVSAVFAALIVAGLMALRRLGGRIHDRTRGNRPWLCTLGQAIMRTTSFFIVMVAIRAVSAYARMPPALEHAVAFFFTLACVSQGAIWAREGILGAIELRTASEGYRGETIINAMGLIRLLVNVAVFAIAAVVLLDNIGVNVTGLVAGLGVGGIAIGLAAQGIFADLFAALAIIFDSPFGKGDAISYGDSGGIVEAIGLKSTRIRAWSGELRIISNKALLDKEILNLSERNLIRLPIAIPIARTTPPETLARLPEVVAALVTQAGATTARAGFEGFVGGALDFRVLVDVPGGDWARANPLRDRLLVAILQRFAQDGVVFA